MLLLTLPVQGIDRKLLDPSLAGEVMSGIVVLDILLVIKQ
jgi:hypothetical protein